MQSQYWSQNSALKVRLIPNKSPSSIISPKAPPKPLKLEKPLKKEADLDKIANLEEEVKKWKDFSYQLAKEFDEYRAQNDNKHTKYAYEMCN